MAKIVDPSASYMSLPMGIARGNPTPIDKTLIWTNEAELCAYASNTGDTALSYVGQILSLVEADRTRAFVIKDVSGGLDRIPLESEVLSSINRYMRTIYTPFVREGDRQILSASKNAAASGDAAIRSLVNGKIGNDRIVTAIGVTATNDQIPSAKATYDFVTESITTLASVYLTKNAAGDSFETKSELNSAIASGNFFNGGVKVVPKANDYTIVQKDESHSSGSSPTTRYIYDGTSWAFQYIVNNTTFTTEQLAAINSTITETKLGIITGSISSLTTNMTAVSGSIESLSGNAKDTDEFLYAKIVEISGGGGGGPSSSVERRLQEITTVLSSLMSTISGIQSTISGLSSTYMNSFFEVESPTPTSTRLGIPKSNVRRKLNGRKSARFAKDSSDTCS